MQGELEAAGAAGASSAGAAPALRPSDLGALEVELQRGREKKQPFSEHFTRFVQSSAAGTACASAEDVTMASRNVQMRVQVRQIAPALAACAALVAY